MKRVLLWVLAAAMAGSSAFAQDDEQKPKGNFTGSFETNTIYYMYDKGLGTDPQEGRFGSNNYLKLDYTRGRLSVGVQFEGYFPILDGFDMGTYGQGKKFFLANKYVRWQDNNFTVHVGDIYEQFGSGLAFRSYEDRALGFNNSIEGVFASYNFNNYVQVKGLYGRPRLYDTYADSWVRGADLSLSLNDMLSAYDWMLSLEGSYVSRYQTRGGMSDTFLQTIGDNSTNVNLYSGRLNFEYGGFHLSGEYVSKSDDFNGNMNFDPETMNQYYIRKPGNAILVEAGYNGHGLALLGTFRRLEDMSTFLTYGAGNTPFQYGIGNTLNFIPSLTRQYTYMLANLHPYLVADPLTMVYGENGAVSPCGEIGGQFDAFYTMRSPNDRRKKWAFHLNFSTFYTLSGNGVKSQLLWQDLNFDVERQWNRKLKTAFLYTWQKNNSHLLAGTTPAQSHTFVYDMTYKIDTYNSFRLELQYLYAPSKEYREEFNEGDWVAALFEYNFAPNWSFYASDMYNIDQTKIHYYNFGFSYSKGRTRVQLSYGRTREGYICSGGVCRLTPAYTGFNLSLISAF